MHNQQISTAIAQYHKKKEVTAPNPEQRELTNTVRGADNPQQPCPNDSIAGSPLTTENVNPFDHVRKYMDVYVPPNATSNNETEMRNLVKFMICE